MTREIAATRTTWLVLVLTALMSCGGREQANPSAHIDALALMQQRRTMRVGYLEWPPCIAREADRPPTGIFADMVHEIAARQNMKVDWVETNLASFATGLATDQFDFSVGPTFVTIPRAAAVTFTTPIAYVGNSGVVRTDSTLDTSEPGRINQPGVRIAVLQGQAMDEYARANWPLAQIVRLAGGDLTAPLAAVSAGQADVGFMNSVTVGAFVAKHPQLKEVFKGNQQLEILPLAWATRPTDVRLLSMLNSAIVYLGAAGKTQAFQDREEIKLLYPAVLR